MEQGQVESSAHQAATHQAATHQATISQDGATSRFTRAVDGFIRFLARHWLAIFNTICAIYVLTPFAAAVFMHMGLEAPAHSIYLLYSLLCHQLPDHSFFLFGPTLVPNEAALIAAGMPNSPDLFIQRTFIGNEAIGYKVALCQRDVAIYASVFVNGLIFALVRDRIQKLRFRWFLLAMIPMAIDGGTQLVGWRESNWLLRLLTGALFGGAAVWWAYPYVNEAMTDVLVNELGEKREEGPLTG